MIIKSGMIAVTTLDADRVLVTSLKRAMISNGSPCYNSVIIHRSELETSTEAQALLWVKCGTIADRDDNAVIVPAVCELLGIENPGIHND